MVVFELLLFDCMIGRVVVGLVGLLVVFVEWFVVSGIVWV